MSAEATFDLEAVGMADIDAILALTNACDIADNGEVDLDRADVSAALSADGTVAWSLIDAAGAHQACIWVERMPHRSAIAAEFFVHPDQPAAAGSPLVEKMLETQRQDGRRLQVFVSATAPAKSAVLHGHGASIVRHFFKMAIDLPDAVADVDWPPDAALSVATDTDEDLRPIHSTVSEAFADHWDHSPSTYDAWQQRMRSNDNYDPSLFWLLRVAGEPAAALVGVERDEGGFIATLGVRRPYRGLGLGRRLLLHAFREFQRRGQMMVALFVDSTNPTGAVGLYESAGMSVVSQWDLHEFPATAS